MLRNKVVDELEQLHWELGTWLKVGEYLAENTNYKPQSLAATASRIINGGNVPTSMLKALNMYKHRYKRCIEFNSLEEAQAHDQMLEDSGLTFRQWYDNKLTLDKY